MLSDTNAGRRLNGQRAIDKSLIGLVGPQLELWGTKAER